MVPAQRTGRSRYRLALLLLTALTLLTLDFRGYGPLQNIQGGVRDLLRPLVSVSDTVLGPVGEVWNAAFDYNDLRSDNTRLRAELDQLRGEAIQVEADQQAYRRLLEATDIEYLGSVEKLTAAVIRDRVGNFDLDLVTIDKGRRNGITTGMAVVTGAGFVGRIETVDSNQSTVELVSSFDLTVGVRLVDSDDVGLGHGVAGDPARFVIDAGLQGPDPAEGIELAAIGSAVVTAAESRYPADIPIGRIVEIDPVAGGLGLVVTVELAVDTRDLGFVTVLLQTEDSGLAGDLGGSGSSAVAQRSATGATEATDP